MSVNEDLWSARLPNGDVRSGTLEQLSEAFRSGHLGESTLVRPSRSDHWIKLADVLGGAPVVRTPASVAPPRASAPPPPAATPPASAPVNGNADLWHVKLASGEVRSGTRRQLVEAFRAGHLTEGMPALAAGAREWVPLGTIMSRSEPSSVAPSAPPPSSVVPQRVSSPPVSAAAPPPPQSFEVPGAARSSASERADPNLPGAARASASESADPNLKCQVRLADGQVRSGTRQQLEEAFKAGHLDASALVLAAGASEWVTLGSFAGPLASAPPPAPMALAEPPPVEAQPVAPVAMPQPPVTPEEEAPPEPASAAPAEDSASTPAAEEGPPEQQSAEVEEAFWQVKLTEKQLEAVFLAGLIGDDALVLIAGNEEWVRLGDLRRPQSDPDVPAPDRATSDSDEGPGPRQEPASRTEPWPATFE
jgi:hypothetical protein